MKSKKNVKKILVGSTSIISIGAILGTGIFVANINDQKSKSLVEDVALNENNAESKNATPYVYTGTLLTKKIVTDLGWDQKTTITLQDWKTSAPNITQITQVGASENNAAFARNTKLISIEIPAQIKSIFDFSFYFASSLTSITFEENSQLNELGKYSISSNSKLTSITIPDSVRKIGESTFESGSFKEIKFSPTSKLTYVGKLAFWGNKSLEGIYIPDGVSTMLDNTFAGDSSLLGPKISMPIALKKGSSTALYGFTQAQWDTIAWRITPFMGTILTQKDVIDLNWDKKTTITLQDWKDFAPNVIQISAPNTLADNSPFKGSSLVSIEIPAKVKLISDRSFYSLPSLTSITFEENSQLEELGRNSIYNIKKIGTITIPDSVRKIGESTFESGSFKEIKFSPTSKLTYVGKFAFWGNKSLEGIYIPDGVSTMLDNTFAGDSSLLGPKVSMPITLKKGSSTALYGFTQAQWDTIAWRTVPFMGTVLTKKDVINLNWDKKANITLQDWKDWAPNVIQISAPNTLADNSPFKGSSLVSIEIPAKVKLISDRSFYSLPSLTSITFEENSQLEELGRGAIFNNKNLKTIAIPDSVKKIGFAAFQNGDLKEIKINPTSKLTEIQDFAFNNNNNLKEIYIPDGVKIVGNEHTFGVTNALLGPKISMPTTLKKGSSTALYGFTQAQWDTIAWRIVPFMGTVLTKEDVIALNWDKKTTITLDDWKKWAPNVIQISAPGTSGFNSPFEENSLVSIQIPAKVKSISDRSFYQINLLNSITFEENSQLEELGSAAIFNNKNLKTIAIPDSVKKLGINAFQDGAFTTITINKTSRLTEIGTYAFYRNIHLNKIYIPDGVTLIGDNAFENTPALLGSKVSMPIALKKGSSTALYGFTQTQWDTIAWRVVPFLGTVLTKQDVQDLLWDKKTTITLDDWKKWAPNVIQISMSGTSSADSPFGNNTSLISIEIPAKLIIIGPFSFFQANSLTSITFEENSQLKVLGYAGINQNSKIKSIIVPDSVEKIDEWGLESNPSLESIIISKTSKLKQIDPNAFANNPKLKGEIYIPDGVTLIGNNAFENTPALLGEKVSMPIGLKKGSSNRLYGFTQAQWNTIAWRAVPFTGTILTKQDVIDLEWDKKTTITLQDWKDWAPNVIQISKLKGNAFDPKERTFYNTPLVSIEIPAKVQIIGSYSFGVLNSLTSITFEANSQLKEISYGAINRTFIESITLPDSLEIIKNSGLSNNSNLKNILISKESKLNNIGAYAFSNSPWLQEIYIPDGVTFIDISAFDSTNSLLGPRISMPIALKKKSATAMYGFTQAQWDTIAWRPVPFTGKILTKQDVIDLNWDKKTTITLDDWKKWAPNVNQIDGAFQGCDNLISIVIPAKVQIIIGYAFNSNSLSSITFEENSKLEEIGYAAIFNNPKLTTIIIPDSVKTIDGLSKNENLTTITISETSKLTTIGANAFNDNRKLEEIYIPNGVTSIGNDAFLLTRALKGPKISMNVSWYNKFGNDAQFGFLQTQWDTIAWRGIKEITDLDPMKFTENIIITGSTHKINIEEKSILYLSSTFSPNTIEEAKKYIFIRYRINNKDVNYKTKDELISYLSGLKGDELNNLDLSELSAVYGFTALGKEKYWANGFLNSENSTAPLFVGLNIKSVKKSWDLTKYIDLVKDVKAIGDLSNISFQNSIDESQLAGMNLQLEWSYWIKNSAGKIVRSEWTKIPPKSVAALNLSDLSYFPIAIRFNPTGTSDEYLDMRTNPTIDNDTTKGYAIDVSGLSLDIEIKGTWGTTYKVVGFKELSNIGQINLQLDDSKLDLLAKENLILQLFVGTSKTRKTILDWTNASNFQSEIQKYIDNTDIAISDLNIFARLVLKDGTGPDLDIVGDSKYIWDKSVVEIYNNKTGTSPDYNLGNSVFLRSLTTIEKTLIESIKVEGLTLAQVKVSSTLIKLDELATKGITLQVKELIAGEWKNLISFDTIYNASWESKLYFRFLIKEPLKYEMKGYIAETTPVGTESIMQPIDALGKKLLNINSKDLLTFIEVSGSTNQLIINEKPEAYTNSGLSETDAKINFEIQYIYGKNTTWLNKKDFIESLKKLSGSSLNNLDLSTFKAKYVLTKEGEKNYFISEEGLVEEALDLSKVIKTIDLHSYISNIPKLELEGKTTAITVKNIEILDIKTLTDLGIKIQWQYWTTVNGKVERSEWVDVTPTSVAMLRNPAQPEIYPIAINFAKIDLNSKIELKDIVSGAISNLDARGYQPNISALNEIIDLNVLITDYKVKGISGNVISMLDKFTEITSGAPEEAKNKLELQFAIGSSSKDEKLIIKWGNLATFKDSITKYNDKSDILKQELNIYMKLVLIGGTEEDVLDDIKYIYDKTVAEIYNNNTGTVPAYNEGPSAKLRAYSKIQPIWADSLVAEGKKASEVFIKDTGNKFSFEYYKNRGISLQVSVDEAKTWTTISEFEKNSFDASATGKIQYRLFVEIETDYQMYGLDTIENNGTTITTQPIKVVAPLLAKGILADNLKTMIKFSGTTNKMIIDENPILYEMEGLLPGAIATDVIEIKYSLNDSLAANGLLYFNKADFVVQLGKLSKNILNDLDLNKITARYEFINGNEKEYYSPEVWNGIDSIKPNTIKKISPESMVDVIRTIDLNAYIINVDNILLTGESSQIKENNYETALNTEELKKYGIKVQWEFWIQDPSDINKFIRSGWQDEAPKSVATLKNPAAISVYPIAIKFAKINPTEKIELKNIVQGILEDQSTKGYPVDVSNLIEVRTFNETLENNYKISGIKKNIVDTSNNLKVIYENVSNDAKDKLEFQFSLGVSPTESYIIDWSSELSFKKLVNEYIENKDIMKNQLNIYGKLILKGGEGKENDVLNGVKYIWDKNIITLYNNETGVNKVYSKDFIESEKFLKSLVKIQSTWADNLVAKGKLSTAVLISNTNAEEFKTFIKYYTERGVKLEVSPDEGENWTEITKFNDASQPFDASKSNVMQYRLSINEPTFYELYSDISNVVLPNGSQTTVITNEIDALTLLTGIKAESLTTNKIKISGTTHDFVIEENPSLYTDSGITDIMLAKTFFEIKYSYDNINWFIASEFMKHLYDLSGTPLNNLKLENFKVKYEFTELGLKKFYSPEISNDQNAHSSTVKVLNTTGVVPIIDLHEYILNVGKVKIEGDTSSFDIKMGELNTPAIERLKKLGIKMEWDYWTRVTPSSPITRAGWVDNAPKTVAILNNPADSSVHPIAIRFVKINPNDKQLVDMISPTQLDKVNEKIGYAPDISRVTVTISYLEEFGKEWFVEGITGNVVTMNVKQKTKNVSFDALRDLEMQFAIGKSQSDIIGPWANSQDFKKNIINYNQVNDILKSEMNIYAKLILKNATNPNDGNDQIEGITYRWDKKIVEVYNNVTGVNSLYDTTEIAGSKLRAYSRINGDWSNPLSAEGDESTDIKILNAENKFNLKYFSERGVLLQISVDETVWQTVDKFPFPDEQLDASATNKMNFRLKVENDELYEIYSDDLEVGINPTGTETKIITKDIKAKKELKGILASSLISDKLTVSGTTHDLQIEEDPTLYTVSGLSVKEAKKYFEIKYTFDSTIENNWFNVQSFMKKLNSFKNEELNKLELVNFKVRYEFTQLGKETYWSREVFGDPKALENYVTKTLNTSSVVKSIDLNEYISNVKNVILSGGTNNIQYNLNALKVKELNRLGVKIQWDYWILNSETGKYTRSNWVDKEPISISILNPSQESVEEGLNVDDYWPIAIRFVKSSEENNSIELINLDFKGQLMEINFTKGYIPNIKELKEIIELKEKIGINYFVKGIVGNVLSMSIDQELVGVISAVALENLEMQFSIGLTKENPIINWSNAANFKESIIQYTKTSDILKQELNIFMKLVLKGATNEAGDEKGGVKYIWDNKIVEIYNNIRGVNKDWDISDIAGSKLRALAKIQSNWAISLEAEGEESTKVGIISGDNSFDLKYFSDRGIKLEVSPDGGRVWSSIENLPGDRNLNAEATNEMFFRLNVVDKVLYEMYADLPNIVIASGDETEVVKKPIKAKVELKGILSNNLINPEMLIVSGTTNKIKIKETDALYAIPDMTPSIAKTFVVIKYSIDGTPESYLDVIGFTEMLNKLTGSQLNNLSLINFKVRYEFTKLGKEKYWSNEVFEGRVDGVSLEVIKTLLTDNVKKTIDITKEIDDIANTITVSGTTENIIWKNHDVLDEIKNHVKIEYGIYKKIDNDWIYEWSEVKPTKIETKDIPNGQTNYPIAIRFMPLEGQADKVEIGSISNTIFTESNTIKGYEIDSSKLTTIINIDTSTLGVSIKLKGLFYELNKGESQEVVEQEAKNLVDPIYQDKVELRYKVSAFPGQELTFSQMKEKLLSYSEDFSNSTSGLLFFNSDTEDKQVKISVKFISTNPEYIIQTKPIDNHEPILNTSLIKTNIVLTDYVKVLKEIRVEVEPNLSSDELGKLILPNMTEGNHLFGGRTFLEIQSILSKVMDFEFKAPGTTATGENWVPLTEIKELNNENDLFVRFSLKKSSQTNVELTIENNNDWNNFMENGIQLIVNLPIKIVTDHKDLTKNIVLAGTTKKLSINDDLIYTNLGYFADKVQILYSIGKKPIALTGTQTEFNKADFIAALSNYGTDILLSNKSINARYALAEGVNANPDDQQYIITDEKVATLNSDPVLIYIHPSTYYEQARKISVDGTSSNIIWSPELEVLEKMISEGLIIQFSAKPAPTIEDQEVLLDEPIDSVNWSDIKLDKIDPNSKDLWIRFMVKDGYEFGAEKELVKIDTSKVRSLTIVKSEWLQLIQLEENTRNIVFNIAKFKEALALNNVAGAEEIVIQYHFGGTVPNKPNSSVPIEVSISKDNWYTAEQIINIFKELKGAKNINEFILFRDTLKARYTLSEEGTKTNILDIDNVEYYDQFAKNAVPINLVEKNINEGFEGYINMDILSSFNPDSFTITGTSKKPELITKNPELIEYLSFYKNQMPFNIYYSNSKDDWGNKNQTIFDSNGFKKTFISGFEINPNPDGTFNPIYFKFEGRPGYGVWEKENKLSDGKIIAITDLNIITEIDNPIKKPVHLEFTGYQGEGSFKSFVEESGVEVTPEWLNAAYPTTDPRPLRLEYNISNSIYTEKELKVILESEEESDWLRTMPTDLKVNQYVIVRVAINNPKFQFTEGSSSMPTSQIRVNGLMIHANSLDVSKKLELENGNTYGYSPLDGQTIIGKATIISTSEFKHDYLGADLLMSVESEFYKNSAGTILLDINGNPIIVREETGATQIGFYQNNLGQNILDKNGNPIPIWMKEENGISIPAEPKRTGKWQEYQIMDDLFNGNYSQQNLGNSQWKLFQSQFVKFTFKPKVGDGTIAKPDFIFDDSIINSPEIKLTNIKYPIQMNGIEYRFEQIKEDEIKYVSDSINVDNPNGIPYTGSSHISEEMQIIAYRTEGNDPETVLKGEEISKQIKKDSNNLVQIKMTHNSPGKEPLVGLGTNLSQFHGLKNGDTIKVEFSPTNENFILSNPFTPWIINIKSLHAQPPKDELFEYLRAEFSGNINGGGSFKIKVNNPANPNDTNEKILGNDLWYQYQVWNEEKTLKTAWTKDENELSNLKNGDKVEWRLFDRNGILEFDNYNTLIYPWTEGEKVRFRVVNVENNIEKTVRDGKGNSLVDNPNVGGQPSYPKDSGWVVSGLKSEISLDDSQKEKFNSLINNFEPIFSGINGLGAMQSNINNDNIISEEVKIVWYTMNNGVPREITDFNKANLTNGDEVWATIKSVDENLILQQVDIVTSKIFIVKGLINPSNSNSQMLTIAAVTSVSSLLLIGLIALTIFVAKNKKINNNRKFKK